MSELNEPDIIEYIDLERLEPPPKTHTYDGIYKYNTSLCRTDINYEFLATEPSSQ